MNLIKKSSSFFCILAILKNISMKTIKHFITLASVALIMLVVSSTNAQNKVRETFTPLAIDIDLSDTKVNLKCTTGCDWKTLSFSSENNSIQWVDATGLIKENTVSSINNNLSPFKISFQKIGDKLLLKSLKGTAWREVPLIATARFTMQINEFGFIQ